MKLQTIPFKPLRKGRTSEIIMGLQMPFFFVNLLSRNYIVFRIDGPNPRM